VRIWHDNKAALAGVLITPSSEQQEFPATYALNPQREWKWKSGTTLSSENIVLDLGSAQSITSCVLVDYDNPGAPPNPTLQANSSNSWGSPPFSTSAFTLENVSGFWVATFAAQSYRYWRLLVTKDAASNVLTLGTMFLGNYFTTSHAPEFLGFERVKVDPSVHQPSAGGQISSDVRPKFRRWRIELEHHPWSQVNDLENIFETLGRHTPFVFQLDETSGSAPEVELIYARLNGDLSGRATSYASEGFRFAHRLDLQEAL
jgi:hypothetical protein